MDRLPPGARSSLGPRILRVAALTCLLVSGDPRAEEAFTCNGPYKGKRVTQETLDAIASRHEHWLGTYWRDPLKNRDDPNYANLCGAKLIGLSFVRKRLSYADFRQADFSESDLSGAFLEHAMLQDALLAAADPADIFSSRRVTLISTSLNNADLSGANLRGAEMEGIQLIGAKLRRTNLRGNLRGADLRGADLTDANLQDTPLHGATLDEADLTRADLRGSWLPEANMRNTALAAALLNGVDLREADLVGANAAGARLGGANLGGADLTSANLSDADLRGADLSGTTIVDTDLAGARLKGVRLANAQYQAATAPASGYLAGIEGLTTVRFEPGAQAGLVLLRAALKEAGLRRLGREATFVIEKGKTEGARWLEGWFRRLLFGWSTAYGLHPRRALLILLGGIGCFGLVYAYPLSRFASERGASVYRVWPSDRIVVGDDNEAALADHARVERVTASGLRLIWYALFFSLLSAFHLGWRELNVGNWISRMQPRQYVLRAVGWARVLSGFQAVTSVYLIAIWALTYFGRPFE